MRSEAVPSYTETCFELYFRNALPAGNFERKTQPSSTHCYILWKEILLTINKTLPSPSHKVTPIRHPHAPSVAFNTKQI